MFNGGEILQPEILPQPLHQQPLPQPFVIITEQPADRAIRFRYECEGRSELLVGKSTTPDLKTLPTVQVVGFQGRAKLVVSCVTKDKPYKPHQHKLLGPTCKNGVCILNIPLDSMSVSLANIGIQSVPQKGAEESLRTREEKAVHPSNGEFAQRNGLATVDLNAVRLCFQVFIEDKSTGKCTVPLRPVVSQTIFNKKAAPALSIIEMCSCVAYADGERGKIFLICSKASKDDIKIRFFEENHGQLVWQDFGEPLACYKGSVISFRPPYYHNKEITEPADVYIQLVKPSDGATSEPLRFQFLPMRSDPQRKRKKLNLALWQDLITNESGNLSVDAPTRNQLQYTPIQPTLAGVGQSPMLVDVPPVNQFSNFQPEAAGVVQSSLLVDAPPVNFQTEQQWNSTSDIDALLALNLQSGEEFKPIHISSGDLETEGNNLSENFRQNLSLSHTATGLNDYLTGASLQNFRQPYQIYNKQNVL